MNESRINRRSLRASQIFPSYYVSMTTLLRLFHSIKWIPFYNYHLINLKRVFPNFVSTRVSHGIVPTATSPCFLFFDLPLHLTPLGKFNQIFHYIQNNESNDVRNNSLQSYRYCDNFIIAFYFNLIHCTTGLGVNRYF